MLAFDLQRVRARAVSADIVGYDVEDLQGTIGQVDERSEELVPNFISVDALQSPLEKRVILPAAGSMRPPSANDASRSASAWCCPSTVSGTSCSRPASSPADSSFLACSS